MTQDHPFELQNAVAAFSEGRYPVAEAICRRWIESGARQAHAWFLLGMALTRQGAHEEAFRCLQQALQIDPRSAETLNALGTVSNALGRDPREAEPFFVGALKLNARCPDAHYNMGVTLQKRRQYEAAATWYERALVVRPDDCEAMSNLAIVYKYLNRHSEGLAVIDRACRMPELTRGLKSFGAPRYGSRGASVLQSAHDMWFAPLLAARKAVHGVSDPQRQVALMDGAALSAALTEAAARIAATMAPDNAAEQRAMEAAIEDEAADTFTALGALRAAGETVRTGEMDTRFADWRRWVAAVGLVFAAADEAWGGIGEILGES